MDEELTENYLQSDTDTSEGKFTGKDIWNFINGESK